MIVLTLCKWLGYKQCSLRIYNSKVSTQSLQDGSKLLSKRLDVVIMGIPNVGKSMLLNTITHVKIAATSRKRNTTRMEILGVYNHSRTQLAFYDTPGFTTINNKIKSGELQFKQVAVDAANKADVVMVVVDATRHDSPGQIRAFEEMVRIALRTASIELVLVINKIDLIRPKSQLLGIGRQLVSIINGIKLGIENADKAQLDTNTFYISALQNDGVKNLVDYLISIAPVKPWTLEDTNDVTNLTLEERVQEMVLEKLLNNTHDEIPYIAEIICTSIRHTTAKRVVIDVDILVERHSQSKIIIGQYGRTLVKIRQDSVEEFEKIFKKVVLLFLWVKVGEQQLSDGFVQAKGYQEKS